MLYNYEIKFSDGSKVENVYSMDEKKAFEMMGKYITEHFLYGKKGVSIVSAKVVGVKG